MGFYVYRISELASLVGLSRTALLYYEKLNLISGKRLENGYRAYSERDLQQVRLRPGTYFTSFLELEHHRDRRILEKLRDDRLAGWICPWTC